MNDDDTVPFYKVELSNDYEFLYTPNDPFNETNLSI